MATRTSRLVVELMDRVSGPARKAAQGILGIPKATRMANGQMSSFGDRLRVAMDANNAALDRARGRMVDAVAGVYILKGAFDMTAGAAMSLEDKMADIQKVSGMSDEELSKFSKTLRKMATKEIPLAVEELGELAAAASQSGIANEDLEEFTRMVAKAGVAWEMPGAQAGESLAKIKTALGLTIEETRAYADVINYLSDTSASKASDLVEFSRRVAADGKVAGFTKEEVLALGATMISMGAQADVAATSLRNAGRMLSRGDFGAKKSQIEAMKELGLSTEKVAKGMQVDASGTLIEVLEAVNKAEPHKKLALMSGIFGDEARALMPLLTELDQTRDALAAVGDETNYLGSVQKEFETRAKTGRFALQSFKNQLRDVAIVIGAALLPGMKMLLKAMEPYILAVAEAAERNPKLVAGIFAVAGAFVALKVAMSGLHFVGLLGKGGALSMLAAGMSTVGRASGGAYRAASSSIALQTALARMDGSKIGLFTKLRAGLSGLAGVTGLTAIKAAIVGVGTAVATISAPVWLGIAAAVAAVGVAWKYWDRISAVLSGVGQAIGEILSPALEAVRPVLDWFAPIGDVIAAGWEKAVGAIRSVGEWLGSVFKQETLSDEEKAKAKKAGYDFIMSLWEGMKEIYAEVQAWVEGIAAKMLAPFTGLGAKIKGMLGVGGTAPTGESVSTYSEFGGGSIDGTRARGGPIRRGGTYLTSEDGPELITAKRDGYVHTAAETERMLSGGGGPTPSGGPVTLNVGGIVVHAAPGMSEREIVAQAVQQIESKIGALFRGVQADTGMEAYG